MFNVTSSLLITQDKYPLTSLDVKDDKETIHIEVDVSGEFIACCYYVGTSVWVSHFYQLAAVREQAL